VPPFCEVFYLPARQISHFSTPRPKGWRRGELNPCPRRFPRKHLHVYPALRFKEPTLHRRTAVSRASANFLHRPTRSLRRPISLLSTFGAVAGVQLQTSRSIKPRERDLGDLRLFFLVRFLTRPTNHPRHAVCASNDESKPVRPRFFGRAKRSREQIVCKLTFMSAGREGSLVSQFR
jgi:hypothetical protein